MFTERMQHDRWIASPVVRPMRGAALPRTPSSRACRIAAAAFCTTALCTAQASAAPPIDPPPAKADRVAIAKADRDAIEATIRQQLDAFGRDDAERAFGYATADIRRQFGSSDNFMRMVQEQYEPVYRASGVQFVGLAQVDGRWVQTVQLVDGEGRVWRALFTMRRQADRSWKVGGCQLVQTSALAT